MTDKTFKLRPKKLVELRHRTGSLRVQAMVEDKDIDWETLELVDKAEPKAAWSMAWSERRHQGDFDEQFDVDRA